MSTLSEIKRKLERDTWFTIDHFLETEDEEESLTIETRDNGSVYDIQYGAKDYQEGQRLKKFIDKNYPDVETEFDTVDEWVMLNVKMK